MPPPEPPQTPHPEWSLTPPSPPPPPNPLPPPPLASVPPPIPPRHSHSLSFTLGALALVIGLASGTAYAFVKHIGPFSHPPYQQSTFMTGLLESAAGITSATYKLTFALSVGPRDADATPYTPAPVSGAAAKGAAYARDVTRTRDLSSILGGLIYGKGRSATFPASLAGLHLSGTAHLKDPNGVAYAYALTNGGTDFTLGATFETPEAARAVATQFGRVASVTVHDRTVTFTKASSSYVYIPSELPKPFFTQMAEAVRYVPAEMKADASLGGTTDFTDKSADWKFNVAGSGDFGDLSYAVDVDVLKKATLYYFRINKLPSIFLGGFNLAKGQWVVVDPAASSTKSLFGLGSALPKEESSYKTTRQEVGSFLYAAAQIADRDGVIEFKNAPVSEEVDGRHLYRYDIRFAKDALAPYAKDIVAELQSGKYPSLAPYAALPGAGELSSTNTDAEYAYYDENSKLTLWVDKAGRPAIVSYVLRVVPPAEATQLANKQVNISMTLSLADINVPVSIEAPGDAVPLERITRPAVTH